MHAIALSFVAIDRSQLFTIPEYDPERNHPGAALGPFLTGLLKLVLASLIAGALMNLFGLSAERLLAGLSLTPEQVWEMINRFIIWAIPNVILGAVIILPLWFFAYLFIPPRSSDE